MGNSLNPSDFLDEMSRHVDSRTELRLQSQGAYEAEGYDDSDYDPMMGRGRGAEGRGRPDTIHGRHYERTNELIKVAHDELMRWINGSSYRDSCLACLSLNPPDNSYFDKFKKGETDSCTLGRFNYVWSGNKGNLEYNKTPQQIKRGFYLAVWNANKAFMKRTNGEYSLTGDLVTSGWTITLKKAENRTVLNRAKNPRKPKLERVDARSYLDDDMF